METEKQPNNFKEAALSHIPFDVIQSMEKQTAVTAADLKELQETVLKKGPAIQATVPGNKGTLPLPATPATQEKPVSMSYAIDGHVIIVPLEDVGAAIMLFYTLLAFVWSKDKHVAKILKQFNFKFFDANKKQIYPPLKKNDKK